MTAAEWNCADLVNVVATWSVITSELFEFVQAVYQFAEIWTT
jgi:hypothetical protein